MAKKKPKTGKLETEAIRSLVWQARCDANLEMKELLLELDSMEVRIHDINREIEALEKLTDSQLVRRFNGVPISSREWNTAAEKGRGRETVHRFEGGTISTA